MKTRHANKGSPGIGRRRADRQALEERRLQAARLFARGVHPAEVAHRLGVSRQSTSVWHRAWEAEGTQGLKRAERAGRPPLLTAKELRQVERALLKGPRAYGWSTELWTLQRVADVIAMETAVRYHIGHVWRILRRLRWSWQEPARRATERDQKAIKCWVSSGRAWRRGRRAPSLASTSSSSSAAWPWSPSRGSARSCSCGCAGVRAP